MAACQSTGALTRGAVCYGVPMPPGGRDAWRRPGSADAAAVLAVWLDGDTNQRLLEDPAYQAVRVAAVETDTATVWVLDLAATPG